MSPPECTTHTLRAPSLEAGREGVREGRGREAGREGEREGGEGYTYKITGQWRERGEGGERYM